MITTTNIKTAGFFDGWILDYTKTVAPAAFPESYATLIAASVLSGIVGRRGKLLRPGYKIQIPTWSLILGPSGIGKSKSLAMGRFVAQEAAKILDQPNFLLADPDTMTRRGFVDLIKRTQTGQARQMPIEGLLTADEASSILTKRTGTETTIQFFLKASEGDNVEDYTGRLGTQKIKDFSMSAILCSSMNMMRKAANVDDLAGGFLFRFLIAHELDRPVMAEANNWDWEERLGGLARRAIEIRGAVPQALNKHGAFNIMPGAENFMQAYRRVEAERKHPFGALRGFWHRSEYYIWKLAMLMCISDQTYEIQEKHVDSARWLVHNCLFPPIEEYLYELSYGRDKLGLFEITDDLYHMGEEGMDLNLFQKRLPATNIERQRQLMQWLQAQKLVFRGVSDHTPKVWRLEKWAKK